ncbi:OBG-type G domain-containing protein [Plasmodiophora brassicae]
MLLLGRCTRRRFSNSVGIVGMPNTGKSTLFNALTRTQMALSANYPFATIEPTCARVPVPDPTLRRFAAVAKSEKVIESQIEFVDIAGLVKGAHKGEGLGNQFLSNIRECDVLVHVVRCFEDESIIHVEQDGPNPTRDLATIRNELILADMAFIEKRLATNSKRKRSSLTAEGQLDCLLGHCLDKLGGGRECNEEAFANDDPDVWETVRSFNLLTSKPVVYVMNVDEDCVTSGNGMTIEVVDTIKSAGSKAQCLPVCIKLEEEAATQADEIAQLDYLSMAGLDETSLQKIISASHSLLSVHSFFTIGPKEARAWQIPVGACAAKAAGQIHSDFEKEFKSAEVIAAKDFPALGDFPKARKAGKTRLEGRDYIVQTGDVILFSSAK